MAAVRFKAARLVPAFGRSCDRDGGIAASRMGGVGRWKGLGDVVRGVNSRFSRRQDARHGFVASRCLRARDRAVLAGVVDDAGDDRTGQCASGVLCQRELAARCGPCRARKRFSPVFGQCRFTSWSCVDDCRPGDCVRDNGSADDGVVVSRSRVEAREGSAGQRACQRDRSWGCRRLVVSVTRCDEARVSLPGQRLCNGDNRWSRNRLDRNGVC